jgi:hypothetical protein
MPNGISTGAQQQRAFKLTPVASALSYFKMQYDKGYCHHPQISSKILFSVLCPALENITQGEIENFVLCVIRDRMLRWVEHLTRMSTLTIYAQHTPDYPR